jgi:hypothetical protein
MDVSEAHVNVYLFSIEKCIVLIFRAKFDYIENHGKCHKLIHLGLDHVESGAVQGAIKANKT